MLIQTSIQERVQVALKDLPALSSLKSAASRLLYLSEIEEGLYSAQNEKLFTTDEALKEIESWYMSDGR